MVTTHDFPVASRWTYSSPMPNRIPTSELTQIAKQAGEITAKTKAWSRDASKIAEDLHRKAITILNNPTIVEVSKYLDALIQASEQLAQEDGGTQRTDPIRSNIIEEIGKNICRQRQQYLNLDILRDPMLREQLTSTDEEKVIAGLAALFKTGLIENILKAHFSEELPTRFENQVKMADRYREQVMTKNHPRTWITFDNDRTQLTTNFSGTKIKASSKNSQATIKIVLGNEHSGRQRTYGIDAIAISIPKETCPNDTPDSRTLVFFKGTGPLMTVYRENNQSLFTARLGPMGSARYRVDELEKLKPYIEIGERHLAFNSLVKKLHTTT